MIKCISKYLCDEKSPFYLRAQIGQIEFQRWIKFKINVNFVLWRYFLPTNLNLSQQDSREAKGSYGRIWRHNLDIQGNVVTTVPEQYNADYFRMHLVHNYASKLGYWNSNETLC